MSKLRDNKPAETFKPLSECLNSVEAEVAAEPMDDAMHGKSDYARGVRVDSCIDGRGCVGQRFGLFWIIP